MSSIDAYLIGADCKNGCYFAKGFKGMKLVPFETFLGLLTNELCVNCKRANSTPCPIDFLNPVYCKVTEAEFTELEETYGVCEL